MNWLPAEREGGPRRLTGQALPSRVREAVCAAVTGQMELDIDDDPILDT